jgi:hypothetical protein
MSMRPGTTVLEMILVLSLISVLAGWSTLRAVSLRDRLSVRAAATEVAAAFATARQLATLHTQRTAVTLDARTAALMIRADPDTLAVRQLAASHGVALVASRDSMAYAANGLGYGAANLTIILRRNDAAETLYVSRLGRVRR